MTVDSDTQITAVGVAPNDGGDPITSYDWRHRITSPLGAWISRSNVTNLTQVFTGLEAARTYRFQFRATNSVGDSQYSRNANATTESPPTTDGPWSNLLAPITQDGAWSNLLPTPTFDGAWSVFVSNGTLDGLWSDLIFDHVGTVDGAWSNLEVSPSTDGLWSAFVSRPVGLPANEFLLYLATPSMPILEAIDQAVGSYEADIVWTGRTTHTELHQVRIRWITRANDRDTMPAPTRAVAMAWDDSESGMVEGDFRYIDTIVADPDAAILGPVLARDNPLMDTGFSDKPLWVMARLEVDEANKYNQSASGTVRPFYVSSERAGGATRFTIYRGDEDAWCVGQMVLQPSPSWLITYEVAGVLLTDPVDSFSWNVPNESIELVISSLVASTSFVVHSIRMESSGSPRWTRAWNTGQQLPDGSYGELVLTNRGATLTVDPILHCP